MLLRGQNLLGYKHYSDDVVEAFCNAAVKMVSTVSVFSTHWMTHAIWKLLLSTPKAGAITFNPAMVYTISSSSHNWKLLESSWNFGRNGYWFPLYQRYVRFVRTCWCIWFGFHIQKRFGELPIDLYSHFTCGLASTTYWEAAKAGVDIIDTAISPFAHATSQPATETMIEMFKGTEWDLGLDLW